jgi:transposase
MSKQRKEYPSDVSDEECAFCAPYLTLMNEQAPQRVYALREIFNAPRYLVKMGGVWRMMPHDLPPWQMVFQQTRCWIKAGCFEAMAHDLRVVCRADGSWNAPSHGRRVFEDWRVIMNDWPALWPVITGWLLSAS